MAYTRETNITKLEEFCSKADFVFHLAGVNRPREEKEYMIGNRGFTAALLETLKKQNNRCPVMFSSSIHAAGDHPYGQSKKAGEDLIFAYGKETGAKTFVYRFPNVFGKWCKPNYNSAVATFCHNIARELPVQVNDPETLMKLVYIDDVVEELIGAMEGQENRKNPFCEVPTVHQVKLGEIVELLYSFKMTRQDKSIPNMTDPFIKQLYSTYLSYVPEDNFSYDLPMNVDHRGSFTEIIRTSDRGQISVNVSRPGITKGNHWHHTKNEKFLVVSGKGVIRFRKIGENAVIEYPVSDEKMEVVDIPPGYTHNIENLGERDMVTLMWVNEPFDPDKPDTYYLEV